MDDPKRIYECLLDYCDARPSIERVCIGPVWTVCQSGKDGAFVSGQAMTPHASTRTLSWPGTLRGKAVKDVARWILQWEPYQATVGMAALNCGINHRGALPDGIGLDVNPKAANLTVFEHFLPKLEGKKTIVVGHYPGIERYVEQYGWQVLERTPQAADYPDPAAEFLLPDAEWVFLTASSLPNKTFPRLAALCANATTVLMGPTVPWLPEWHNFGIDYLAGVDVVDADALFHTAAEGGGVRIFETGVRYKVLELTPDLNLAWLKQEIAGTFSDKERLTQAMELWYATGNTRRFPHYGELNDVTTRLSRLDSAYKTLWDAQKARAGTAAT
ncbi:MAG: Rossmann-like domain-containing protein [Gammaproteobacteria bacterium]